MTLEEVKPLLGLNNPVIIVNDSSNPRHALLADLRPEQMNDIHLFEKIKPYLGTVERTVSVGYFTNGCQSMESFTYHPIEPNQIFSLCPSFEIDNYRTSFFDLLALMTSTPIVQAVYNAVRPPPSVREGITWCTPEDLNLTITIGSEGHSRLTYSGLGLTFLKVNSHADSFKSKIDLFRKYITHDETGLYQTPSQEALEERVNAALLDAKKIDDYSFNHRFSQYSGRPPYYKSLLAVRNLAARMNPSVQVPEERICMAYESTWNEMLQQRLPAILETMQYSLSALLTGKKSRGTPLADNFTSALEAITDRVSKGVVSLNWSNLQRLGRVIVLNQRYEQMQNQERVDRIQGEIQGYQEEIRNLASKSEELLGEMKEVQEDVNSKSLVIQSKMRALLGKTNLDLSSIDFLIRTTDPDKIEEDEDFDEIPF